MQVLPSVSALLVAGGGCARLSRVLGSGAQPIVAASALTWTVTDLTTGQQLGTGSTGWTVYANLVQNDPRWNLDSVTAPGPRGLWGYNVEVDIPATAMPGVSVSPISPVPSWSNPVPPPHQIQIDVAITVSGVTFRLTPVRAPVLAVYG
jgi:hypothetical protein